MDTSKYLGELIAFSAESGEAIEASLPSGQLRIEKLGPKTRQKLEELIARGNPQEDPDKLIVNREQLVALKLAADFMVKCLRSGVLAEETHEPRMRRRLERLQRSAEEVHALLRTHAPDPAPETEIVVEV